METPRFLTLPEVLSILRDQTTRYRGEFGVRDLGLVSSAIAVPQLLDLLYAIADHLQHRYHHPLLRYYAELRDPPQSPGALPTPGHDR